MVMWAMAAVSGCGGGYSFSGGDTGSAKTFSVGDFPNNAELFQPNLSIILAESLRNLINQQTRLELSREEADLQFEGAILGYVVEPLSAQGDGTIDQNRLTITVQVAYTNTLEPTKSFERTFTQFANFEANENFSEVEEQLITQICRQLSEDITNQALVNW
ncbi:hypothetical protein GC167_09755 [bacterium]|nr:hypothetical protein [bacterium]